MDSNHRSLARNSRFLLWKANCGDRTGAAKKGCFLCGTEGSKSISLQRRVMCEPAPPRPAASAGPVEQRHTQLSRTVILYPEVGWHTTLALYAALERHRLQIAAKVITPGMVNALKILAPLPASSGRLGNRGARSGFRMRRSIRHYRG